MSLDRGVERLEDRVIASSEPPDRRDGDGRSCEIDVRRGAQVRLEHVEGKRTQSDVFEVEFVKEHSSWES